MKRLRPIIKNLFRNLEHIKTEKFQPVSHQFSGADLYFMDESRFGLHAIIRRALAPTGIRPVVPFRHNFSNFYIFGAYSPIRGAHHSLRLPYCNSECFQLFMDSLSEAHPATFKILVLDNGAFHKAKRLIIPQDIALLFLPPYSPELNGAERIWNHLKGGMANQNFKTLELMEQAADDGIVALTKDQVISIAGSPSHIQDFNQCFNV